MKKSSSKKKIKILWIPGLGANEIMYKPIVSELSSYNYQFDHHYICFFDVQKDQIQTLEEYCELLYKNNINIFNKNYELIIGTSLGGMILQILYSKNKLKSKRFLLLSTAFCGKDLTVFSKISIIFLKLIPSSLRRKFQNFISFSYRFFRFGLSLSKEFSKMFYNFPTNVFFEAPLWIYYWKGVDLKLFGSKKFYVIHGTNDPLISFKKIYQKRKPDLIVSKGNHILFAVYPKLIAENIINLLK